MRLAVALVGLLAGCGDVLPVVPDAPEDPIDAPPDATPPDAPVPIPRLYALTTTILGQTGTLALEVVDLRTMTRIRNLPLGLGTASSLAISPDGTKAYVASLETNEVGVFDTVTGTAGTAIGIAPRDMVLSPDGARLYGSVGTKLASVDTVTGEITFSPDLTSSSALGIALSPDGQRLAAAASSGGSSASVTLFRTSDMSVEMAVPVVTNVPNCLAAPVSVVFANASLVLAWDNNCDELYQVDAGTHAQLTNSSIATGRDSASGGTLSSRFAYSNATNLAYAIREDQTLAIMNPDTLTFTNQGGFTDLPYGTVSSEDGATIYVSVSHRLGGPGGADTLDTLDTATTAFTRDAYTFMSPTSSVVDMAIVTSL